MSPHYDQDEEIERIVINFENCITGKADFKHCDHLTVAVSYLQNAPMVEATSRLRSALLRFLDHHGIDRNKYNETVTVFWMEMVASTLREISEPASLAEECNYVIDKLNDAGLVLSFYSKELLHTEQARRNFVEPDLREWKSKPSLTC